MIAAAVNAAMLCLMGWSQTGDTMFLWRAAVEGLVLGMRYLAFRNADRYPDLWFLGSLVWPMLHGSLLAVAVASGLSLIAMVLVSALGAISVLVARHFAARRYVLVQSA
jgi:hypothetical protein